MHSAFVFVALAVASVHAIIQPTTPGPGESFKQGEKCRFAWDGDLDSPDTWKETNVQLMTGADLDMVHLDTVATIDGTQTGVFEFDCPAVDPYSAIYFYQFSTAAAPSNKTWATRFTITSPTGESVPPPNKVQPGTQNPVPWGIGKLVDPSKARPAPAYLTGGGGNTPPVASGSLPGSGGASNTPSTPAVPPAISPSNPALSTPPTNPSTPSSPATGGNQKSQSSASSAPKASETPENNGAASLSVLGKSGVVMSMIAGVFVLFL